MGEYIRAVKITIYVDTNKATYEKEFDDITEASEYLEEILSEVG
jgi:hypothetical protein